MSKCSWRIKRTSNQIATFFMNSIVLGNNWSITDTKIDILLNSTWAARYRRWRAVGSQSMAKKEDGEERQVFVQGRLHPRHILSQGHVAHQHPPLVTDFKTKGYSYPRLSSQSWAWLLEWACSWGGKGETNLATWTQTCLYTSWQVVTPGIRFTTKGMPKREGEYFSPDRK